MNKTHPETRCKPGLQGKTDRPFSTTVPARLQTKSEQITLYLTPDDMALLLERADREARRAGELASALLVLELRPKPGSDDGGSR